MYQFTFCDAKAAHDTQNCDAKLLRKIVTQNCDTKMRRKIDYRIVTKKTFPRRSPPNEVMERSEISPDFSLI
jgi:hypothetical protein